MTAFSVWAPARARPSCRSAGPRHPMRRTRRRRGLVGGGRAGRGRLRHRTTRSGWTAASRCRTRAPRGSRSAARAPSRTYDHAAFRWTDRGLAGRPAARRGDLRAARRHVHRRGHVRRRHRAARPPRATSASTSIELMPVAAFPGQHGWGYDGIAPVRRARAVRRPGRAQAVRRRLPRAAAWRVLLDVVYNHLGHRQPAGRLRPVLHRGARDPVGAGGEPGPARLRRGARAS